VGSGSVGALGVDLLGTKIAPPTLPRGFLRRRRLEERLDTGVSGPVTLVSAGPGWGKTLAVASWAHTHRMTARTKLSWLALDRDDNDPSLFWGAVIASLQASGAVMADDPLTTLGRAVSAEGLHRLRSGFARLPAPSVLVLDDFQVIDHPDILESIAVLLRHQSPLRLVLISRTDPVLPVHRLRVSGALQEIRAVDLAFDEEETGDFLRLSGQVLPDADVSHLAEHTEGWPAGLRLAAMFLSRNPGPGAAADFAGDDQALTDYLLGEVIASQPPRMRSFLLATSVPDQICAELADVLLDEDGGGQRDLEQLEQSNTFITALGAHRRWYRYHPLLREALQHLLLLEDPVLLRSLHRRAATWFAAHGAPVPGLRHAAAAEDWTLLGELFVTSVGPLVASADRQPINEVLALIPAAELTGTAALQACAAARLEYLGRIAEIAPVLARARRMLVHDTTPYAVATAAIIGLWGLSVARLTGDLPVLLATCTATLAGLAQMDTPFPVADQFRAIALNNQGAGLIWTGNAIDAEPVLHQAMDLVTATNMEYTRLNCLGNLGLAALVLGRLDEAETWASQSLTVADDRGWTEQPNAAIGYLVTGTLHLLRGDPTEAERLLAKAGVACREPLTGIAIGIARTLLDASRDRPQSALRSARAAHHAVQKLSTQPTWLTQWLGIATVEADLAAGQQADVAARVDPDPGAAEAGDQWTLRQTVHAARAQLALNDAQRADRMLRRADTGIDHPLAGVDLWLATALAADRLRDDHRAREAITRAVHIAAPQRICLPFLTFDRSRVPQLLERLVDSESTHAGFVNDLLRLSAPTGQPHIEPVPLREPLTARELAVLELLPTMQSNNEIADEMFVSVNTVKAHLKGLYRKLDVQNRRSAVHRGRTLQLIA